jgi:RNA polymerase sigma factor (sigma-70 family)
MVAGQPSRVIEHLRQAVLRRDGEGLTDAQLLGSFIAAREEAAFEALVRRHGAMVLGVCRRVLRDPHEAEDAFQATFLVLVPRAAAVVPRESVGNFLYGVAYRTALKARAMNSKRRAKERVLAGRPGPRAREDGPWHELQLLLDHELNGLPDKYCAPVVLCDLERKTHKEAARHLGWPEGTLSTRLVAARRLLAKRLTRRGLTLSASALGVALTQQGASASVPAALLTATVKAASLGSAGPIPATVAALLEGVLKTMFGTQLKTLTAILLGVVVAAGGAGLLGYHSLVAPAPAAPPADGADKAARAGGVSLLRVPDKGIQPQVVVDAKGVVHMIYFRGRPGGGDVFYVRSDDGGAHFSAPLQVNSQADSVIAIGTIRGAHLALGKNGRVHVAWMGSDKAEPKAPHHGAPMLYSRLNDHGTAFEPQRNVIHTAVGLDGGGSVGADESGNVYVAWHAPAPGVKGEENRRVWVARSADEGKTFAAEKPASEEGTGACGCCGMRAFGTGKGSLYMLYRSATHEVNRDTYLLASMEQGSTFRGERLQKWNIRACPMSSFALAEVDAGVVAAWETEGQVYFARVDPHSHKRLEPVSAPGASRDRKHPVVAGNARKETILVWTEGTGWDRGGALAWQVFDKDGRPTAERGRTDGVPTWSLAAVFARPDGGFTIVY